MEKLNESFESFDELPIIDLIPCDYESSSDLVDSSEDEIDSIDEIKKCKDDSFDTESLGEKSVSTLEGSNKTILSKLDEL